MLVYDFFRSMVETKMGSYGLTPIVQGVDWLKSQPLLTLHEQ